jgi:Inner membrane protein YgaP-like, transmembrane domain
MLCNVGKTERVIRVIVGLAIIAAGFSYQSWWGAIGLVPLLTGATGYCPPYQMLGISTNKK